MADRVSVTLEIAAPPEKVWAMVADLGRMHEWSPENDAVTWSEGVTGAAPGASFTGTNSAGTRKWVTRGTIVEATPGRVLSFRITALGMNVALWCYRIEPTDGGCAVTESWDDERGVLDHCRRQVGDRGIGPGQPQSGGHGGDAPQPEGGRRTVTEGVGGAA